MGCPAVDVLLELVERRLTAPSAASIEEHLDACEACRRAVASLLREGESTPRSERRLLSTKSPSAPGCNTPPLRVGDRVDQYEVESLVGGGGMAFVYRARDTFLGRQVALKVLREPLQSDRARAAFLHEAQTTARFQHPNIVTVFGAGESRGHAYLALEYIDGITLRTKIEHERIAWRDVAAMGQSIVRALLEAHAAGVVHCDLKPNNVIVAKSGRLAVLDFGLARALHPDGDRADGGAPAGTPAYMAPEQWCAGETTPATDVWALGVMFFELLAGARPFDGESPSDIKRAVLSTDVPPIPSSSRVPSPFVELTRSCLARAPDARPSLADIARELEHIAQWDVAKDTRAPFRGLRSFTTTDAAFFFGRDVEIVAAVTRMRDEPMLLVLGASGAGKSSFVRAGLLPRLGERGARTVLDVLPGRDPLEALARALAQAGIDDVAADTLTPETVRASLARIAAQGDTDVVLFVDQLEEAFAPHVPRERADVFARCVLGAADETALRVRVITALREDFLSRLAACRPEPLSGLFVLAPPPPPSLLEALTGPVSALGYRWEPVDLPQRMVRAVEGESAAPSLLQFAADQLWEARDRRRRTLGEPAYDRIGGVGGALTRYADHVLAELGEDGGEVARQIFLRLLSGRGARRIVTRDRVAAGLAGADAVLERLIAARLVSLRISDARAPEVEVAHEALVVGWPRLRRWLDASREGHAILSEAEQAAVAWERRGAPDDSIWRGGELEAALRAADRAENVPPVVRRFLEAGKKIEDRARAGRRRLITIAFSALTVVALLAIAGSIALRRQRQIADARRDDAIAERARAEKSEAEALRSAAAAALERGDLAEARAGAYASLALHDDPRTRTLARRAFSHPLDWKRSLPGPTLSADLSPSGQLVAAGGGRELALLDAATGQVRRRITAHGDTIVIVRFSPDGSRIVSGAMDGRFLLWDASGDLVARLSEGEEGFYAAAFSGDGRVVAGGGRGGKIHVFDAASHARIQVMGASAATVNALVIDASGERMWSGDNDGMVREWNPRSGELRRVFARGPAGIQSVALAPDEKTLVAAGASGEVSSYDVTTSSLRSAVRAHRSITHALAFDPEGGALVSGGHDHALRSWIAGAPATSHDQSAAVWDVRFAPGHRMVSAVGDRTVRAWNLGRPFEPEPLGHGTFVDAVAISPDGKTIASGGNDRTVRLWDAATGSELRVLRGHAARVWDVRFSDDGRLLASTSEDQSVRIWELEAASERATLTASGGTVYGVAFGKGDRLATISKDGLLRIWDLRSSALIRSFATGDASGVVRFLPNGVDLVTTGLGGVRVWSSTGRLLRHYAVDGAMRGLAIGPRGEIASARAAGEVLVFDDERSHGRAIGRITGRLDDLIFTPDGTELFATTPEGSLVRWSARGGESGRIVAHRSGVSALAIDTSGALVVTGGEDGTVRAFRPDGTPRWSVRTARPVREIVIDGWKAIAAPDGAVTMVAPSGGATTFALPSAPPSEVTAIAIAPPLVAIGHVSGEVRLWHRDGGLLEERRVHGAVLELEKQGGRLVGRSELGSSIDLDLSWLSRPRCALLADLGARAVEKLPVRGCP